MGKIHDNPQEAQKACQEYIDGIAALREKTGVWEYCEDSCADMIIKTKYRDPNGEIRNYYHC